MTKVVVIGAGNIGQALAAFLGSRPELHVVIWGRRWASPAELTLTVYGAEGTYAIGTAFAEPSLRRALEGADVAIIAVPTHVRRRVLEQAAPRLTDCAMLVSWEGTGWFREHLKELGIERPIAVGLQRSPILCRVRSNGQSVEIFGVRTEVVAATTKPADRSCARQLLDSLLPFGFAFAPSYECVSLSPSNPLIHPARVYSFDRPGVDLARDVRFYADWDDAASEVLLLLHGEVARLRDELRLPRRYLRTLADQPRPRAPSEITRLHRTQACLAELQVPVRQGSRGRSLDRRHRFFREDIGEGLAYILDIASHAGVEMPAAQAIYNWYHRPNERDPRTARVHDAADHSLR